MGRSSAWRPVNCIALLADACLGKNRLRTTTMSLSDSVPAGQRARRADPLFQPLTIKHLTLRNRVMSTSHACGLEDGGMPTERYQLYHEEKAKGGLALTMIGGSSNIAPDSPNIFR